MASVYCPSDQHEFQAETRQLLDIVAKSLYSEKEVFIRELISNASDALEKLRYLELTGADVLNSEIPLEIHIRTDDAKKTFTLQDTGLGLTRDELVENLGTIAKSGSKAFVEQLKGKNDVASSLIGQFGVGFYSTFMVGEKVEVYTQSYKSDEPAYKWTSDGTGSYEISEAEGVQRGTKIVVHLKGDCYDYSKEDKINEIVKKYSNFVGVPIFLNGKKANIVEALWMREGRDITEEMHEEFYRFIANAYDKPRYHMHYKTDAPLNIRALFYVPEYKPTMFDMSRDTESSVTLYSRKVMITPNASTILPKWLRFVKGVVDSEDIPLNLSRELLQDSALIRKLRIVLTNRVIKFFIDQAKKDNEKFMKFYEDYGLFLREGIVTTHEQDQREDIAKLLRFESSNLPEGQRTTLNEYAGRMKAGARNIYFLSAPRFKMETGRDSLPEGEILHESIKSINSETDIARKCLKLKEHQDGTPHVLLKINKPMTINQTCSVHQGKKPPTGNKQDIDAKKVSNAVSKGDFKPIVLSSGKPTFITFDLETTDFIRGDRFPHITQIAASEIESNESFSTYVLPELPMSQGAQYVTGVTVTDTGIMKVKGKEVNKISIKIAIQKLCEWLDNFPNVVLVAHNGRSRHLAETSPYYEALKKKDIEVLFLYEPYDELVLMNLGQFDKKNLKSVENELADDKEDTNTVNENDKESLVQSEADSLIQWLETVLTNKVNKIKVTKRLVTHPCIVTVSEMGAARHFLRTTLAEKSQEDRLRLLQPTLELNPSHPLIKKMFALKQDNPELAGLLAEQLDINETSVC
ncbi:hypothetical protein LOTGIDRAFT_237567 [Lottia gigantea]|uniref:Heat shock protein 75 kDa, mitochondrial n=1 Tax=Lottia gigantea TaxID=225164 RepID=V4CMR5_LOTGI|nr:hypothetical protein LOTGIDRAFT_237567 [Lottia gigantea]ESP03655.1 hypothetical protein LOTGIDRAFT_237567 [Lottia gigantea]